MKKLITICFALGMLKGWSQCSNMVSPSSAAITCSSTVSFTATAITPTANVRHDWYSPLNPLPGGVPILTSTMAVSVLSGSYCPGEYTVITTDLGTMCQVQKTFTITSLDAFPSYNVASSTNYLIGCSGSQTTLSITNPVSTQTPPATCGYTFLPPGFAGTLAPAPWPGLGTSTVTSIVGTWSFIVIDNSNMCMSMLPVTISTSTNSANFTNTVNAAGNVSYQSTSTGTTPATIYNWDFGDGASGTGVSTAHTYSNGGVHHVTLTTSGNNCFTSLPVNVNTIPCTPVGTFTCVSTGTPQIWYAMPGYWGNVTNVVWNWGDGNSDNTMFPVHTYSAAGLYNICLSVTVSCATSASSCTNYSIYRMAENNMSMVTVSVVPQIASVAGIKNIEAENNFFSLYPNPSNSEIYIQNPLKKSGEIKVFNFEGKLVQSLILEENKESKIENLNSGIYFIEIKSEGSIIRKKVVVIK